MDMVLSRYQVNWLRKSGDELRGRCPIHQGEGERTFHVNLTKNAFNCFSCKARGNVLDFVAAMEQCSVRDAALKLKEWFAVGESGAGPATRPGAGGSEKPEEPKPAVPINPPLRFQLKVDPTHAYGLGRGLTRETLETFGAGFCLSKGTFAGRFVIPLHDQQGQLAGYAGRSIEGKEPKYLFPSVKGGVKGNRQGWGREVEVAGFGGFTGWEGAVLGGRGSAAGRRKTSRAQACAD